MEAIEAAETWREEWAQPLGKASEWPRWLTPAGWEAIDRAIGVDQMPETTGECASDGVTVTVRVSIDGADRCEVRFRLT